MNKVHLVGRLVRDPELRYTEKSTAYSYFDLAVKGYYNRKEQKRIDDFIRVTIWGKQAQTLAEFAKKGWSIAITGRLSPSKYEKDGKTVYSMDVVADEFEFVGKPKQQQ